MSVLILKNIASEGPGTIEDFLRENTRDVSVVDFAYKIPLQYPDAPIDNIMKIDPKIKGLINIDLKKKRVKNIKMHIDAKKIDLKLSISLRI